ncbi:MAG: UPF0182 family protein [Clostridia bacterium]|nr:UPF0182 family protein [Clostridia bacterium]
MVYDYNKEINLKSLKRNIIIGAVILFILAIAAFATGMYMKVIQLKEISGALGDFSTIYFKDITYKLIFSAAVFLIIFTSISITNKIVKRNVSRYLAENSIPAKKIPIFSIAAVIAIIGAIFTKDFFYEKALNFLNSTPFGKNAPIFDNVDIGYFVFQRPFYMALYQFASTLWLFVILYTVAYYVIMLLTAFNNITVQDLKVKSIVRHNLINIAIFFIIKAITYKFQKEGLLYSTFFSVKGAGYVDINIWMNYFKIAPFLLVAIALVAFWLVWRGKLRKAAYSIAVFPAVWILVTATALVTQNFIVKPNESEREKQYLKYNMQQTRAAYGLDKVKSHQFPQMKDLTPEVINKNLETKNNIRIVDYNATLNSNIQLQSNTNFYTFKNGDIVNYVVNGKEIPVFITAREIDRTKLPNQSFINKMFRYTHGYGVVVNPINKLTPQGQVDFLLSGLRMDSVDEKNLNIKEPRIYYGELTDNNVIVNPNGKGQYKEIDYDGTTETNYNGEGGIKLGLLNRFLFSLKSGDTLNMLTSGNISSDSKLLLNRNIIKRAQMAVPFLSIDNDPYIILTKDGKLKWVLDAYTTTNYYPYAQNPEGYGNFNYIRNSVKVIVDAYNGAVEYYVIDKEDPIIKTYMKIYPGIFKEKPLPADIADHMRYPELLFKVQTEVMRRYHLNPDDLKTDNVAIFYSNQDRWDIAKAPGAGEGAADNDIEPYYNMIKLPGGISKKEELILMRPYTPSGGKHNMVSWLAVRNSVEDYGDLVLFNFPKNTNILGPDQVEVNINQIAEISESMTLWNQSGSKVFKGNLLVIPFEESVLYVEPIYIKSASQSSIPQVRKVVVGFQKGNDFIHGVGDTLDAALDNLFEGISTTPVKPADNTKPDTAVPDVEIKPDTEGNAVTTPADKDKIIKDIRSKYDSMKKQLDELGKLLDELNK